LTVLAISPLATAQPVPLPPRPPVAKDRGPLTPPAPRADAQASDNQGSDNQGSNNQGSSSQAPIGVPSWFPKIFGGGNSSDPDTPARPGAPATTSFNNAQRALADKVSAYLSSVQVLSGDFVQQGPDGRQVKGQFFIQKPGKVRFEYDDTSPIEIVADGSSVVVRDRKLGTQDTYPLSQTPLRFLLSERIDLLRDTNVVSIASDPIFVTVAIDDSHPLVGNNRLMLMFDAKNLKLKQWTITDAQGYDTTVAVSNLDSKTQPDPNLFRIDYTHYIQ
jgi:outer membrane lipoprotein-sorting protein